MSLMKNDNIGINARIKMSIIVSFSESIIISQEFFACEKKLKVATTKNCFHSLRRATIGSTFEAFHAGYNVESTLTTTDRRIANPIIAGLFRTQ